MEEIKTVENVVDTAEEMTTDSKVGLYLGAATATVIVAGLAYKFIVKPVVAKIKANKEVDITVVEDEFDEDFVEVE